VEEFANWVEYITFDGRSSMADLRRLNGRDKPWKVKYWAIGNESGGCGGRMSPEYYANVYRRYQTYVREYSGNEIYKVACGPDGGMSYHWTEKIMDLAHEHMDGMALHNYVWLGEPSSPYSTVFEEDDWFEVLHKSYLMDEYLEKNGAIMDNHDPDKRIGLIVDEWGAWYDAEPGTNPGFCYQ
jgi:alpha-N-arabinofuranosidase